MRSTDTELFIIRHSLVLKGKTVIVPVWKSTDIYFLASGSEFTVTNIDADELRKSQRKKKTPQVVIQQAASSQYGINDSDDDDDEASTPSGENTDRNPMSLFSLSSESLDQLVCRERYLQSTFESMERTENEVHTPCKMETLF